MRLDWKLSQSDWSVLYEITVLVVDLLATTLEVNLMGLVVDLTLVATILVVDLTLVASILVVKIQEI